MLTDVYRSVIRVERIFQPRGRALKGTARSERGYRGNNGVGGGHFEYRAYRDGGNPTTAWMTQLT